MQLLLFALFIFVAIKENDAEKLQSSKEAYNTLILYHFRTYRNSKCFDRIAFKLFSEISLLTQLDILGCITAGIKYVCGAANALRHTYRFECCTNKLFLVVIELHRRRRRKFVDREFNYLYKCCTFIAITSLTINSYIPIIGKATQCAMSKAVLVFFSLHFLCLWSDRTLEKAFYYKTPIQSTLEHVFYLLYLWIKLQ